MGKPHKQEDSGSLDSNAGNSVSDNERDINLDNDDEFIDDWISHVDDFDSSDDLNDW